MPTVLAAAEPPRPWWDGGGGYRLAVRVRAFRGQETDFPVQVRVNFNGVVGPTFRLEPASIRVVECEPATGRVLAEQPCTVLPTDRSRLGLASLAAHPTYDGRTPPLVRATKSGDIHPAHALATGKGFWEPVGDPPYHVAVDLGAVRPVHAVWVRNVYDGYGQHQMRAARVETSTDSADGLLQGTWQPAAAWDLAGVYVNGMVRAAYFDPRPARHVRLTITSCHLTPRLAELRVYGPIFDAAAHQEYDIGWIATGRTTDQDRLYFIYFDPVGARAWTPASQPERPAVLREAELLEVLYNPSGVGFQPAFDPSASGPAAPNILSVSYEHASYFGNAAGPITVPRAGKYAFHFRLRGNNREHPVSILLDNRVIFEGAVAVQGEDWSYGSLLPLELPAGRHAVEVWLRDPTEKPLQLDLVLLSADPTFLPRHFLVTTVGSVEKRS